MKHILLLSSLFIYSGSFTQTIEYIDFNNAKALIADDGIFFQNQTMGGPGYEISKGDSNHTCYSMSFWLTALDASDQLHAACQKFGGNEDMFTGPISDDYNSTYYNSEFGSSIWKVSRAEINFHTANYTTVGYIPVPSIANWPGNGDISEGVAAQLAPYVDVNSDNIYNPIDGDYPYIQGDQAVYVIMNDLKDVHVNSGGDPLGVEIHVMFYQFGTADDINNTTFMNVKIHNRSAMNYHDFRLAVYMDFDIGFYIDDYCGSDSTRNLIYGYNGVGNDSGGGGQPGYGNNPPAFGLLSLNHPMESAMYYNNSGAVNGDPNSAMEYYYYSRAKWKNGQHLLYGGNGYNSGVTSIETNFMFTGNPYLNTGWNEFSSGNAQGDRRMVMGSDSLDLDALSSICYDYAFIFSQAGGDYLSNVNELLNTSDFVQNYYDNNIQPCNSITVGLNEKEISKLSLFPNPSTGQFTVQLDQPFTIEIYNLNGKLIHSSFENTGSSSVNIDVEKGMYLVKITTSTNTYFDKIQVIK